MRTTGEDGTESILGYGTTVSEPIDPGPRVSMTKLNSMCGQWGGLQISSWHLYGAVFIDDPRKGHIVITRSYC